MFEVRFDLGLEGSGFWQRRGVLSHGKASARKRGGGQADLSVQSPVGTPQVRPSGAEIYGGARAMESRRAMKAQAMYLERGGCTAIESRKG